MVENREIFIDMTSKSTSNSFLQKNSLPYLNLQNINITESNKYLKALKESLLLVVNYDIARTYELEYQLLPDDIEDDIYSFINSIKNIVFYVEKLNNTTFPLNETRSDPLCYIRLINLHINNDLIIYRKLSGDKYDEYTKTISILIYFILNYQICRKKYNIKALLPRRVEAHLDETAQSLRELITLLSN